MKYKKSIIVSAISFSAIVGCVDDINYSGCGNVNEYILDLAILQTFVIDDIQDESIPGIETEDYLIENRIDFDDLILYINIPYSQNTTSQGTPELINSFHISDLSFIQTANATCAGPVYPQSPLSRITNIEITADYDFNETAVAGESLNQYFDILGTSYNGQNSTLSDYENIFPNTFGGNSDYADTRSMFMLSLNSSGYADIPYVFTITYTIDNLDTHSESLSYSTYNVSSKPVTFK